MSGPHFTDDVEQLVGAGGVARFAGPVLKVPAVLKKKTQERFLKKFFFCYGFYYQVSRRPPYELVRQAGDSGGVDVAVGVQQDVVDNLRSWVTKNIINSYFTGKQCFPHSGKTPR